MKDPVLTIVLTLTEDGQVGIKAEGPGSANKVTMLGLLEVTKAAIVAQAQQQPAPPAILGAFSSLPRNGRR